MSDTDSAHINIYESDGTLTTFDAQLNLLKEIYFYKIGELEKMVSEYKEALDLSIEDVDYFENELKKAREYIAKLEEKIKTYEGVENEG